MMKKIWNKTWEVLLKHCAVVYTACIMLIICFGLLFYVDVQHTSHIIQVEKDKAELMGLVGDMDLLAKEQKKIIEVQNSIIDKQNNGLLEYKQIILIQDQAIKKLIEFLKSLGEWPPNTEPIDPDKWT